MKWGDSGDLCGRPPGYEPAAGRRGVSEASNNEAIRAALGYQSGDWRRRPATSRPRGGNGGDPAGLGWRHWGRDSKKLTPAALTVEMWPDLADFPAAETYAAPGFTGPDGTPARLFSSADATTVERHFGWMRDYGIDGARRSSAATGSRPRPCPSSRDADGSQRDWKCGRTGAESVK
jgi:hypothetical protein